MSSLIMPDIGVQHRKQGRNVRKLNSNLSLKLDLRLELGGAVPDGPVYMAYAGSCVLAAAYPTRAVYAVDNKASMFAEGVPGNVLSWVVSDCEQEFPFPERSFAIADFDAFAMPYPGLLAFMAGATLAGRMALFFTDTALLRVFRHPQFIRFPCGRKVGLVDRVDRLSVWRNYVPGFMLPCLQSLLPGYSVVQLAERRYRNTIFWGVVLSL